MAWWDDIIGQIIDINRSAGITVQEVKNALANFWRHEQSSSSFTADVSRIARGLFDVAMNAEAEKLAEFRPVEGKPQQWTSTNGGSIHVLNIMYDRALSGKDLKLKAVLERCQKEAAQIYKFMQIRRGK